VGKLLLVLGLLAILAACGNGSPGAVGKTGITPSPGLSPTATPSPPGSPNASPSPGPPLRPSPGRSPSPAASPSHRQSLAPSGEPDCGQSALRTVVHTDRPSYTRGEAVTVTIDVTNAGAAACAVATPYPQTFGSTVQIVDAGGTVVWAPGARAEGILVFPRPVDLAPGQSYTWTTAMWDQHYCQGSCANPGPGSQNEGGPVPAGAYRAEPLPQPPSPADPATFSVTG
jgi:hypothetical protein